MSRSLAFFWKELLLREEKSPSLPIVPGYHTVQILGRGAMGAVYEAVPFSDPTARVAIKIIAQTGAIHHETFLRFQKEATLMGQLYHPNIVTFLDFGLLKSADDAENSSSSYFIAMEMVHGKNLKEIINLLHDPGKDVELLFKIGKQLASALDYTHSKDTIHRDIKPHNIIVSNFNSRKKEISAKLVDFGVAGLLNARQYIGDGKSSGIDDFAGTPLYMAPEQSGMTNQESDHRVDIYSLGCVFFEILTRSPPFSAETKQELRIKHLSEPPPNLRVLRPDIPPLLCDLIEKCLEKDPIHRYQSAFSLSCDLELIEQNWKLNNPTFLLGSFDRFNAINAQINLVGRNDEYAALIDFFTALESETRSRISILSGASGVGKSRLVQEVRNYLIEKKVRFVSGTFSRHDSEISFNALASAFDEYLLKVKRSQPSEAQRLIERFSEVLGPSLAELSEVIPILKEYRSEESVNISQSGEVKLDTFTKNFLDFTSCLMFGDQPFVFIFDDIHNADDDSLKLIDDFFTHSNSQRLYLIVTCKEEYIAKNPLLRDFVEKIEKLKRRHQHIKLDVLKPNQIVDLLRELLGEEIILEQYVDWVLERTTGNPLQVMELARTLVKKKCINENVAEWQSDLNVMNIDEGGFRSTDLAIAKLSKYPEENMLILQFAAVIGLNFGEDDLVRLSGVSSENVSKILDLAKFDSLISEVQAKVYKFNHQEIKEAIVDGIVESRLASMHLSVAALIETRGAKKTEQDIFGVSHHYNLGIPNFENVSLEVVKSALNANLAAAGFSESKKTYHFSAQYYHKAIEIIKNNIRLNISNNELAEIYLKSSSVFIKLRNLDSATNSVLRAMEMKPSPEFYRRASLEILQIHSLQGRMSESVMGARKLLGVALFEVFSKRFFNACAVLLGDAFSALRKYFGYSSLHYAVFDRENSWSKMALKTSNVAYQAAVRVDFFEALKFQIVSSIIAGLKDCGEEETVNYLLNRIAFLNLLGLRESSRELMTLLGKNRGLISQSKAKIQVYKNIYFDFGRSDRIKHFDVFLNRAGYDALQWPQDGQLESIHRGMVAWSLLKSGDISRSVELSIKAFRIIPIRNPSSAFAFCIYILALSIEGGRDQILQHGRAWLSKRALSKARKNDIFSLISECLINQTMSDRKMCRELFDRISTQVFSPVSQGPIYPHEKEVLNFFLIFFPLQFECEFGAPLLNEDTLRFFYRKVYYRGMFSVGFDPNLSFFKVLAVSSQTEPEKLMVDFNRLASDLHATGNEIFEAIIQFKIGVDLWKNFKRSGEINHGLVYGLGLARKLNLPLLLRIGESRLDAVGVIFAKTHSTASLARFEARQSKFVSSLIFDFIDFFSLANTGARFEDLLEKAAELLILNFGASGLFLLPGKSELLSPKRIHGKGDLSKLLESVSEFAIGSVTSFIPFPERNWLVEMKPNSSSEGNHLRMEFNEQPGLFDETNVGFNFEKSDDTKKNEVGSTLLNGALNEQKAAPRQVQNAMGCLIPIRHKGENLGYLFADEFGEGNKLEFGACRSELDFFGCALGSMIALTRGLVSGTKGFVDQPEGSFVIEPCSWLSIWHYGDIRQSRESSWYFGANLRADLYLIVYANLGGRELVRKRVSKLLWIAVNSWISIAKSSSEPVDLKQIYSEIGWILQHKGGNLALMSQINLSFSLISSESNEVNSAYFGQSRPWIVSGENSQKAFNEAVVTLENGTVQLHYYEVSGNLNGYLPIVVTRDSSKLDRILDPALVRGVSSVFRNRNFESGTGSELHSTLMRLIGVEYMPRHYLGAVLRGGITK